MKTTFLKNLRMEVNHDAYIRYSSYIFLEPIIWVEPAPRFNFTVGKFKKLKVSEEVPAESNMPVASFFHSANFSNTGKGSFICNREMTDSYAGYFGNEASVTDFYLYTSIYIHIPSFEERARFRQNK